VKAAKLAVESGDNPNADLVGTVITFGLWIMSRDSDGGGWEGGGGRAW
jgi:hypothetical protein